MGKTFSGGLGNTALTLGSNGLLGDNPVSQALGLSGEQGTSLHPETSNGAVAQMNKNVSDVNSQGFQNQMRNYATGNSSSGQATQGLTGAQKDAFMTGGDTGSKYATEQVQNNGILGQMFGQGGQYGKNLDYQNQAQSKEQELQNQGYKLTDSDREAYGQASGNIARQFGNSENNLSQSLAKRGLSAGASGAAGAQFSGLNGNKNEMLAQAQTQIADARMNNTMKRIGQQQQFVQGLQQNNNQTTQIGANAINDQYGRQARGAQMNQSNLQAAAGAQNASNSQMNSANLAALQDERGAKGKTLLEGLGGGLMGSANAVGNAPGQMVSGAAGGAGAAGGTASGDVPGKPPGAGTIPPQAFMALA